MGTPRQQAAYLLKNMKVLSAYMLAVVGGNDKPDVAAVKKIMDSVGITLDDGEAKSLELVEEMAAKELSEILEAGHKKLKTVPGGSGGGGGGGAGPAAAAGGGGGAAAAAAEEEEEEEEMAPAANLFGDEGDDY